MKQVKLKFFSSDNTTSNGVGVNLQISVDKWLDENDVQIKRTTMQSPEGRGGYNQGGGGQGIVLCVEYYEIKVSHKKLITEKEE